MTTVHDLTWAQKLYCAIMNLDTDEIHEYPPNLNVRVNRVLQCIDNPYREVLNYCYVDGLTPKQVAAETVFSEERYTDMLNRAVNHICQNDIFKQILNEDLNHSECPAVNLDITTLSLSNSIIDILHRSGIYTVKDLVGMTEQEVLSIPNMNSQRRVNKVKLALEEVGCALWDDTVDISKFMDKLASFDGTFENKILALVKNDVVYVRSYKLPEKKKNRVNEAVNNILTVRERGILLCRFAGDRYSLIAEKYAITESGAKALVTKIAKKLRTNEAKKYIIYGIVDSKFTGASLDDSIDKLYMSGNTTGKLKREGYAVIGDLANMTLHEFSKIDGFGAKRFAEVLVALKERAR